MRLPLCLLALALSAWAADIDTPQPVDTPDQAPAAQTPAPVADAAKPADAAKASPTWPQLREACTSHHNLVAFVKNNDPSLIEPIALQ